MWTSLTPTLETQASLFLSKYPAYNGCGVRVGILDTGCDPGVLALQRCPNGQPKLVGLVDATGSGDVIMSKEPVCCSKWEDGVLRLKGASGRVLRVNPSWKNPSGAFWVGCKSAFELFPRDLRARIKRERGAADRRGLAVHLAEAQGGVGVSGEEQSSRVGVLTSLLAEWESEDPGYLLDVVCYKDEEGGWRVAVDGEGQGDLTQSPSLSPFSLRQEWATLDPSTLLSWGCNVYESAEGGEGKGGATAACPALTVSLVTDAGAHGTHVAGIVGAYNPAHPTLCGVAPGVELVSVRIGDGRLGSMETLTGLMRGVKAALDAGCHIINLSYGEPTSRPGVGRFLEELGELVGERGVIFVASAGNNGPALTTVGAPGGVSPHVIGVGACVSLGMAGDQYALREGEDGGGGGGVGMYTWSSRGPAANGALGVSITAPGGAITCIPRWCTSSVQLMNGTSMSAPNATGCIALLLSGLLSSGVGYTPYTLRRALENTAVPVPTSVGEDSPEVLGTGHGLIQVCGAWEMLTSEGEKARVTHPRLDVSVPSGGAGCGEACDRGVYWRDPAQVTSVNEVSVSVTPVWRKAVDLASRVPFSQSLILESTSPTWCTPPSHLLLANATRAFLVLIDPRGLEAGRAHYCEVRGYEDKGGGVPNKEWGPLFRIPVTIVKPQSPTYSLTSCSFPFAPCPAASEDRAAPYSLTLTPGALHRRFIAIPHGATWAEVCVRRLEPFNPASSLSGGVGEKSQCLSPHPLWKMSSPAKSVGAPPPCTPTTPFTTLHPLPSLSADNSSARQLVVHAMQVARGVSTRLTSEDTYLRLGPGEGDGIALPLFLGGKTLEVVVGQFWSSLGSCDVSVTVVFHGVSIDGPRAWGGAEGVLPLTVTPLLHDVVLRPVGKLVQWVSILEPVLVAGVKPGEKAALPMPKPLLAHASRDNHVSGRVSYSLSLTYNLSLPNDVAGATLALPTLSGLLYEGGWDAQLACIVTSDTGRLVAATDAFPESLKLKKGDYKVHFEVRHEDSNKLLTLRATGALLEFTRKLEKDVAITFSTVHPWGSSATPAALGRLRSGVPQRLYLSCPPSAAPTGARPGDVLKGWCVFEDELPRQLLVQGRGYTPGEGSALVGRQPKGFPVSYIVQHPPTPSSPPPSLPASAEPAVKTDSQALHECLFDAALKRLESLNPFASLTHDIPPVSTSALTPLPSLTVVPSFPLFGAVRPIPTGMSATNDFWRLHGELLAAAPGPSFHGHLKLLGATLAITDDALFKPWFGSSLESTPYPSPAATLSAAQAVIKSIDSSALASWFGVRRSEVELSSSLGKTYEELKVSLVDALWRQVRALCCFSWEAVRLGGELLIKGGIPRPQRDDGSGVAVAATPISVPPIFPPFPSASDEAFEAAVSALSVWSPFPCTGDKTRKAGLLPEGPHAPLIALERALRQGAFATALDIARATGLGGSKSKVDGLKALKHRSLLHIQLYCAARLGWSHVCGRLGGELCPVLLHSYPF